MKTKEEEMMDIMAEEIRKEIDEGIISNILVESGWTPVKFYFKNGPQATDIQIWLAGTCTGDYRRLGSDYVFENKQDAEWFMLRWL
jgi:hypothetical protein